MENRPAIKITETPAAQPLPGETVFIGRLVTQADIDAANAHHDALAIRDKRESGRTPFTPRTSR